MKRKITNPKPYLSHQPLFGGLLIFYFIFRKSFRTYKHAVYQRLKGPVWDISADLLAATARFVFSAVLHALVISIYIYIKSGWACDEVAKWLLAPAAAERANVFTAARGGKLISRDIGVTALSCHWMPPNLPPWASNLSPSTPNVDQSQVGESLPEIKKDKTPSVFMLQYLLKL